MSEIIIAQYFEMHKLIFVEFFVTDGENGYDFFGKSSFRFAWNML